jgi:hypothetical protein
MYMLSIFRKSLSFLTFIKAFEQKLYWSKVFSEIYNYMCFRIIEDNLDNVRLGVLESITRGQKKSNV